MKGRRVLIFLICACLANVAFEGQAQFGQIHQIENIRMVFRSKPKTLTNAPTIGPPIIVVLPSMLGELGEQDVTNLAVADIGGLLVKSGRFTLTYAGGARCGCNVTVTDLEVKQTRTTSGAGAGQIFNGVVTNFLRGFASKYQPLGTGLSDVDWSKDQEMMNIRCAVWMSIIDLSATNVVAEGYGMVQRTDTTKAISMAFAGINGTNDEEAITNTVDFKGNLIQLAAYYALGDMLPTLDDRLASLSQSRQPSAANASLQSLEKTNCPPLTIEKRLETLNELLQKHLITQQDYDKKKEEILNSL